MDVLLQLLGEKVNPASIRKVSSRCGGEYHAPCPVCGGTDRFVVFPEQEGGELCQKHGVAGTWACPRHCGTGGDAIAFLTDLCGLSFAEACERLHIGLDKDNAARRHTYQPLRRPELAPGRVETFSPREYASPAAAWTAQGTKLALDAHAALAANPAMLRYLAARGLPVAACEAYRLGYIEGEDKTGTCIFRQRSAFGLPSKTRKDGTLVRAVRIPRGITIPVFGADGQCQRIRIRRRNADLDPANKRDPKYLLVPQPDPPYSAPLALPPSSGRPELATWVVVEAELDAMAVHHACSGRVGALSVLTVAGKPDKHAHTLLSQAARILVALDFDVKPESAGNPTADAWPWWKRTYPHAKLWPVPAGKDPGEAVGLGIDLWADWIALGMPDAPLAAETATQNAGSVGNATAGAPGGNVALPLPDYLSPSDVPPDVMALYRAWRLRPVRFRWLTGDDGRRTGGFAWEFDQSWAKASGKWGELLRIQSLANAPAANDWLVTHKSDTITSRNLLHLWG